MVPVMSSPTRFLGSAGLAIGLGVLATASSMQAGAQSGALQVTSDTPEYCLHLLERVSSLVAVSPLPPPPDVARLSSEGQRMCDHGETRGGIIRLRRAWLLMKQQDEQPVQ